MSDKRHLPTVIVVFGATGDLMARKITPALFDLFIKGELPRMFRVIGVSRRKWSHDDFRSHVEKILHGHVDRLDEKALISKFVSLFFYHQGTFEERNDYTKLAHDMGYIDQEWKVCSNKLFYLAVPPEHYKTILRYIHDSHLTDPCSPEEGWTRVLIEKPFGKDLESARELDHLLGTLFKEEQIYRIDHYLGKEMLQNIITFRFANNFMEKNWNGDFIERIDIRLLESLGVEKRGAFYDGLGAFRDVGQNHLLQMLALVTMENPQAFTAHAIRAGRARLLSYLKMPTFDDIQKGTIRGQYKGYRSIDGVLPRSTKETFFKVTAELMNPRWKDVPIYLVSGKKFPVAKKDITITFRHTSPCLCPNGEHVQNKVRFTLEPEEQITIDFFSKEPGLSMKINKRSFDYLYRPKEQRRQYVEEYEKLLLDCILGDQTLFVSTDEVDTMWQFTDAVVNAWEKKAVPLEVYDPHSFAITEKKVMREEIHEKGTLPKTIGIIGLGKMGSGIAKQLSEKGWNVHAFNRTQTVAETLIPYGITCHKTIADLIRNLPKPRIVWLMVTAGEGTEEILFGKGNLASNLSKKDIVIDAANGFYKDAVKRSNKFKKKGITFIDVGFSGGPEGARRGGSLMVGGNEKTFQKLKFLFESVAVPRGVAFFPGIGAGHFIKMIHNGIEYGMMQAIAEGFTVLHKSSYKLDVSSIANIYNHGSVIESRLIAWLNEAFDLYGNSLDEISGTVAHTGEGKWTVETAREMNIKTKVIQEALQFRIDSEKNPSYTGKVLSALRNRFGGHSTK
jgi:glucose-6-phosphate 1-dehydrogenase